MRPWHRISIAVLAVSALAACSSSNKSPNGSSGASTSGAAPTSHTLTLSFLQDPGQPPDPAVYYAGQGLILQDNLYDGLVQYAPGMAGRQIAPDLATTWMASPDNTTFTFHLRQGVTFHDGTPFTSAAVKPSFVRDAAVNGGPAYMAQAVSSITAPDPTTVVITLASSNASFLDYLASPYGPRIYAPTALAANAGSDHDQTYLQTHDLGTGPYMLTKAQVGIAYQLSAYPGYWGKRPYYTTVNLPVVDDINTEILELQNGQIAGILHDLTEQAINSFSKNASFKTYTLPTLQSEYLYVNPGTSFLTSAANRVALLKALDLKQIVHDVYAGRGTEPPSLYPTGLVPGASQTQIEATDTSALKAIVAGLPSGQKSLTIGYDTSSPDDALIAEIITNQLDAAGLIIKSVGFPTGSIYNWSPPGSTKGAPDLLVEYVWPDAYDPYQWSHIALDPNGGINFLHCNVPNSTTMLDHALQSNDLNLFGQVGDAALQQGCLVNLVDRADVFVTEPWLKGVAESHVSAEPNTIQLAGLYPG